MPLLYTDYGIPDTTDGRFDTLSLHISVVLDRLEYCQDKAYAADVGQDLFDVFVKDMDLSLREKGVGDMGVPKHMRRMLEGFNGRHTKYRDILKAFHKGDEELAMNQMRLALAKNIYGTSYEDSSENVDKLLLYIKQMVQILTDISDEMLYTASWAQYKDTFPQDRQKVAS